MKFPGKKNFFIICLITFFISIVSIYAVDALPGSNAPEGFPNGCIDCHSSGDGYDYTLKTTLSKYDDHPSITRSVNKVPNDCSICHTADYAGDLKGLIHKVHLEDTSADGFVKNYGQNCLACHTGYPKPGEPLIKSAPKNW